MGALALALAVSTAACGKSSSSARVMRVGFVPAEDAQQVIRNIGTSVLLYRPPPDQWLRPAAKSELGLQGTSGCAAVVLYSKEQSS